MQADEFRFLSGTELFYPPEYFKFRCYKGEDLDFWSATLVLYTMVEGTQAFRTTGEIVFKQLYFHKTYTSMSYKEFIRQALHKIRTYRLNFDSIWHSTWLNELIGGENKNIIKNKTYQSIDPGKNPWPHLYK